MPSAITCPLSATGGHLAFTSTAPRRRRLRNWRAAHEAARQPVNVGTYYRLEPWARRRVTGSETVLANS
jgi:hypothetical protein